MSLRNIPLSALCPPKDNPRRNIDHRAIEGLAASIQADGLLQNLIVEPNGRDKFRIISGNRRYMALKLLQKRKVIDGTFKVPVEIRTHLGNGDSLRLATVENVQRANLDPIDEAEAFAALLQNGASLEDLSAKTGLSSQTIRRRLALADLAGVVKTAVRKSELTLGVAEALTLGTRAQQKQILEEIRAGSDLEADGIRALLISEKPSVALAIFPLEKYTGTFTRDLFGEEETTFFDDVELFWSLQKEAVEALAESHRQTAAWVDVHNVYAAPWWQYRKAKRREPAGVAVNLTPSGRVEVQEGLARHEVKQEVVAETREAPQAPAERPAVSNPLVRHAAIQKSIAVQAALLDNPRKAKEVALVYLLQAFGTGHPVRINVHPCLAESAALERRPKAFTKVRAEASRLLGHVRTHVDDHGQLVTSGENGDAVLRSYKAVQLLSDEDLDRLCIFLVCLSFGQRDVTALDREESLFNRVASDIGVSLRAWWTPDAEFLSLLRKDQLEEAAIESGASLRLGKLRTLSKRDLIDALARHFERTADPAAKLDEYDAKGRAWLPGVLEFPARATPAVADKA